MSQKKEFVTNSKRIHEKFDISHNQVLVIIDKILKDNHSFFYDNFIESTFISRQNKNFDVLM